MVRPHPSTRSASDGEADNIRGESSESEGQEGSSINSNSQAAKAGWEEDTEEAEDAPELTKEFYEEVPHCVSFSFSWLPCLALPTSLSWFLYKQSEQSEQEQVELTI